MHTLDERLVQVVPSPRQLALQQMEFYAFVHFTVNTFTDKEWGDGTESPAIFNPVKFDAHQWVSAIQDAGNNHTRFICISKDLQVFPGSDKTSIIMTLPHQPGALYKVMARLYALGINVTKLESRPMPDRDFEFMFYFDLDASVYSQEFLQLMCELESLCESFKYLGSYSEVV